VIAALVSTELKLALLLLPVLGAGRNDAGDRPVHEIELEFAGNERISSTDLRVALSALTADLRREGVDDSSADDAVYELSRFYAAKGYPGAQIAATWSPVKGGFKIGFQIVEGTRSLLDALSFSGNLHLQDKELRECFHWEASGLLGLGELVFAEPALADGLACVETRYEIEGYHFVRLRAERQEVAPGRIQVTVEVDEGPRVYVREVFLEGVGAFSEDEVRRAMSFEAPVLLLPRLPMLLKGRVLDFYRTRGYAFVDVQVERRVDREQGEAVIGLRVQEGPRATIEDLRLEGNQHTWDGVVKRHVKLRAGDLYNEALVRESYRSLLRSGLFASVSIEGVPLEGDQSRLVLDVHVDEKPRYQVSALVGYGSYEQVRGALVLENINVLGSGHRLRLEGRASLKGERAAVEYLNPFFFSEDFAQDATAFYERREHPSFTSQELGGETGFAYHAHDNLRMRLFHRLRQSNVLEAVTELPPELAQNVLLSSINVSSVFDDRNNFINPDRGKAYRVVLEYAAKALGSELDFLRATASSVWIFPLGAGLRLVPSAKLGAIQRLGTTDVIPIQERFFLGGESSIRSFRQDNAGPQLAGKPLGGEAFLSFSLELRFPIPPPLPFLAGLDGAVFGDAGTVNERIEDFGGGRYLFGVGVGLRYNTPVGPFRLDLAFNPDRAPGEDLFVLHFGLGYPF
jgi:outer membrane protein insertion porin family